MAQIVIKNLRKEFGAFTAVQSSSFTIEDGEFFMLLGPSGCGKTTTLRMIAGLELPTSGEIYINGTEVSQKPASKRDIAFVFQMFALYPHMNVRKNISYPLVSQGMPRDQVRAKVAEVAEILGITALLDKPVGGLSGGDRQRVALGRAVVRDPACFLMDEPLGALDKKLREWLQLEIKRIHRELGTTFVYVTHDQEEALVLSDRIAVFNHGRIEQVGTGRELYDEPATLFVGKFIGESTTLRGAVETSGSETCLIIAGQKVVSRDRLADGRQPVMLLRPEKLWLAPADTGVRDGHNSLSGQVSEAIYLGSSSKYQVVLADGSVAIVRAPLESRPFAIGEAVDLTWASGDAKLLADDERADLTLT